MKVLFSHELAPLVGKAMLTVLKQKAREQIKARRKGGESVWTKIARGLYIRYLMHGQKTNIVISCKHPAAQLKQYGGWIRAGGTWAEPSPFHQRKSKLIPMMYRRSPLNGKRLGLQTRYKFHVSSGDDSSDDDMQRTGFVKRGNASYKRTRLHSIALSKLFKPDRESLQFRSWAAARSRRAAASRKLKSQSALIDPYGTGLGNSDMSWFKPKTKEEVRAMDPGDRAGYYDTYDSWMQWKQSPHNAVAKPKKQKPLPKVPKKPQGKGWTIVDMWRSKIQSIAKKTFGKKGWHAKKEEFMARTRLVFIKTSRKAMVPVCMMVPEWFIPPHKGVGWIPDKNTILAEVHKELWKKGLKRR